MSPAAHALDRLLQDLRAAHESVSADLAALEAEGTYAVLAGGTLLSGATAAAAEPALAAVAEVRQGLDLLAGLLTSVAELRTPGDDSFAADLFAHITGPCIVLPGSPARAITPHDLLASLPPSLAPTRTLIHRIDQTWRDFLPHLDRTTAVATDLAPEFGVGALAVLADELPTRSVQAASAVLADELPTRSVQAASAVLADELPTRSVQSALAVLAERVVHDPLGAAESLAAIDEELAAVAETAAEVRRLRGALAAAAQTVDELEALIADGRDGLARSRTEIRDPGLLLDPVDPAVITGDRGLSPWLTRLDRLVAAGEVALADKGLASWQALADKTLATAREVATVNARPSRRRQELKDLLRAARVKAGASGRSEDPHLTDLAHLAQEALAVPCTLTTTESRIAAYVEELRLTPTPAQSHPR